MTLSKSKETRVTHLIVVPLRLQSSRLPKKVIAPIAQVPLGVRVLRKALQVAHEVPSCLVVAAVDSAEVRDLIQKHLDHEVEILMTSPRLRSGSDRVFAAYKGLLKRRRVSPKTLKCIVNLQGDTPFLDPQCIEKLMAPFRALRSRQKLMGTLAQIWPKGFDPHQQSHVKVVCDRKQRALYFSRFPIPCSRSFNLSKLLFHIGVYAYTPEALERFCSSPSPDLEHLEGLEQLRALDAGIPMFVETVKPRSGFSFRGVDTSEDLEWAESFCTRKKGSS